MLMDNVKLEDIEIGVSAENFEEAIRKSAEKLLARGAIEASYVEAMIRSMHENGPYIVIAKNVALAHARPEFGVNEAGLTFSTMKEGVVFGSEMFDPVKLVITLAATSADDHLELLGELAEVLMEEERVLRLIDAKTEAAFYEVLTEG
ncbi:MULTISPECIES: PTS sugar transporter subunit IIA [Listeria]|uniref:PTS sugar transporter subunit IIA n=1 Tax=Listeria TaxID=1637 RepID=UPI000B58F503|nr:MULTISPECIES: PTS sugar transporter subunit IIA [Listeria]